MENEKITGFLKTVVVLFMLVIVVSIVVLANTELTARESGLLGILLTLLSVVAGAIITHLYSASSHQAAIEEVRDYHQKNLRTYALKAAEKVNNLSKELGRLVAYLEEEVPSSSNGIAEELQILEERIHSTIHIINTLKSVNDTSLSDWQGVIGDELNEQREEEEEREQQLRELIDRFEELEEGQTIDKQRNAEIIRNEIDMMKKELRQLISQYASSAYLPRHLRHQPTLHDAACPICGNTIRYKQKPKPGKKKSITCRACETALISEYTENEGFILRRRQSISETVQCPTCKNTLAIDLDELVGANDTVKCANCEQNIRVSRTADGLGVAILDQPKIKTAVTEELVEKVREKLPAQPWPKQIHRTVAEQLGIPSQIVQKAIQQLILKGIFHDQVDGQICTTEEKLRIIRQTATRL